MSILSNPNLLPFRQYADKEPLKVCWTDNMGNSGEYTVVDTVTIPTTPPRALLVSMAMRLRHDFGMDLPGVADRSPFSCGMTLREREVLLTEMAQLYEEVAGKGFYRWTEGAEQRGWAV